MLVAFLFQLSVQWSVLVFETHAERENTTRDESEKKRECRFFELKAPGKVLIQHFYTLLRREHPLEPEISSRVFTTLEENLRGS